jgi:hypothetical protein
MKLLSLSLAVGAVLAAAPVALQAQQSCINDNNPKSCALTVTTSATVNTVMQLTLSSNTTDLGTPTVADFNAGFKDAVGPSATVSSNIPWTVTVAATNPFSGPMGTAKPASDVSFSATAAYDASQGKALGSTGTPLFSGKAGQNFSSPVAYRTKWSYASDAPGAYSITVTFTLAGQ